MKIKRISILDGKEYFMDLNITQEELDTFDKGLHAQKAFSKLNRGEREFMISGITPTLWEDAFNTPFYDDNEQEHEK